MKAMRTKSLRYHEEQAEIEVWLTAMETSLKRSVDFAMALAELPRVLKGWTRPSCARPLVRRLRMKTTRNSIICWPVRQKPRPS